MRRVGAVLAGALAIAPVAGCGGGHHTAAKQAVTDRLRLPSGSTLTVTANPTTAVGKQPGVCGSTLAATPDEPEALDYCVFITSGEDLWVAVANMFDLPHGDARLMVAVPQDATDVAFLGAHGAVRPGRIIKPSESKAALGVVGISNTDLPGRLVVYGAGRDVLLSSDTLARRDCDPLGVGGACTVRFEMRRV